MTTQEALIKLLENSDLHNLVKDVGKTKSEIVKLLIDDQKLQNRHQEIVNDALSSELEYVKILREYEINKLYEDGEVDHND